jgi:glycerol-3-phosphate dehydrogenase
MSKIVDNVVVFGGGAWGTALAKTISQNASPATPQLTESLEIETRTTRIKWE